MFFPIVAAIGAMAAGHALQHRAQNKASARQAAAIHESMMRQQEYQKQAQAAALARAQAYKAQEREAVREDIAQETTQRLLAPVQEAHQQRDRDWGTSGEVSNDYLKAQASSSAQVLRQAHALARILGQTTSAAHLRMNEGIALADTSQEIGRIAGFANGRYKADQLGIQAAGQPNGWQMALGGALQGAGSAALSGAVAGGFGGGGGFLNGGKSIANFRR